MKYALGLLLIAMIIFVIASRNYKRSLFKKLDTREDPLKLLYSASARIFDFFRKLFPSKDANTKLHLLMRRLCVRENVEQELYLYSVRKTATIFCTIFLLCAMGILLDISTDDDLSVKTLSRGEYGDGDTSYSLNADYNGSTEAVEISVQEEMYTDDEILELFENSLDAIKEEVLAENSSFEDVNTSLDLITEYDEISISWEIEDTSLIDYSGDPASDIEEDESCLVNLYMTLSIEDVSATYTLPVCITAAEIDETAALIAQIEENIEENNSVYDSEVVLPDTINGTEITFSEIKDHSNFALFILGIIAAAVLIFGYDKLLDRKIKARDEQLMIDFTEIVFKLSLLYEAGLSIYGAFERIVSDHEAAAPKEKHFAYQEMKLALEKIKNGANEAESYSQFGKRCGLQPYVKLGNLLEQNLNKGTKGMKILLHQEAQAAFEERTRLARKKGEQASTKMLFPMVLMLIVVIVIVAFPAMTSISF